MYFLELHYQLLAIQRSNKGQADSRCTPLRTSFEFKGQKQKWLKCTSYKSWTGRWIYSSSWIFGLLWGKWILLILLIVQVKEKDITIDKIENNKTVCKNEKFVKELNGCLHHIQHGLWWINFFDFYIYVNAFEVF